jgi:hypothetical protein
MEQKASEHCFLGCDVMYFTNILEEVGASIFRLEAPVIAVNLIRQAYFLKRIITVS